MNAQKREDFINNLPKSTKGIKSSIGGIFHAASSAISNVKAERTAKRQLERDAYRASRKAARKTWDSMMPERSNAEKAVMY